MSDTAPPAPVQDPPPAPPADVITMTKAELEAQVAARIAAAVGSNSKKLKADLDAENAEIKAKLQAYQQKELEEKGRYAESLKLQEQSLVEKYEPQLRERDDQIKSLSRVVRDATVGAELVHAAQQGNAVNPKEIARLLDGNVKDASTVVDDAGNQRFVAGKPMTPTQLVQEYLQQNPHHVKASQTAPGGGAGGGASRTGADTSELALLEKEVADLEAQYSKTKDSNVLDKHRAVSNKLRDLRLRKSA